MPRPAVALLVAAAALAAASPASANGRYPASKRVALRPGHDQDLVLGLTFGAVITHDGGARWSWTCEQNVGYGGSFDPRWAIDAADGTLYAATHNGLRVSRDGGCTFETARLGDHQPGRPDAIWVDALDVGPDGAVWIGTTETGLANAVYRSTDQARTFQRMGLESATIWWKSVRVAPSDPQRIYVSGYQVAPTQQAFLERSTDGGATWSELPTVDLAIAGDPAVLVVGVDPTDADVVYVRVPGANVGGDRVYRSGNGGTTWADVLDTDRPVLAFAVRGNGDVLAGGTTRNADGTGPGCTWRSTDRGRSFSACQDGPQMECAGARADGDVVACGNNWDPDDFALARSGDGQAWTPAFRFHQMAGPIACPAGTVQHDVCELQLWPGIREQFGVTGPVDAGPVGGDAAPPAGGCCDSSGEEEAATLVVVIVVGGLLFWRGRRKKKDCCR